VAKCFPLVIFLVFFKANRKTYKTINFRLLFYLLLLIFYHIPQVLPMYHTTTPARDTPHIPTVYSNEINFGLTLRQSHVEKVVLVFCFVFFSCL